MVSCIQSIALIGRSRSSNNGLFQDLSSFNLNLGDFGKARLVSSLDVGDGQDKSRINVVLSKVDENGQEQEE